MLFTKHPLWLVGFRPFFILACLAGFALPILWVLMLDGILTPPGLPPRFTPVQWHAHEMFFGFGWAVLGGFLLTATKNWVNIRGYHGAVLIALVFAWLLERAGMWASSSLPTPLFQLSNHLFLASIVLLLLTTLVLHRKTDSYRDNLLFLVVLPTFIAAKILLLSPDHFALGSSMALGLFRMAFLIMLERTLTQFMKGIYQLELMRSPWLDHSIKGLALLFVLENLMPQALASTIALLLAALLLYRWFSWKPQFGFKRIDLAVMYLGTLAIAAQLLVEGLGHQFPELWFARYSVHIFTFGTMGLIIPAMLIRISNGHTGRKVVFAAADKTVLWIMITGFLMRVVAPQFWPNAYPTWLTLAATCWAAGFLLLGLRITPKLLAARVDGREH